MKGLFSHGVSLHAIVSDFSVSSCLDQVWPHTSRGDRVKSDVVLVRHNMCCDVHGQYACDLVDYNGLQWTKWTTVVIMVPIVIN